MVNSDTLALVKEFEGCKLKAYRCPVGKWTIGYGHTKGVKPGLEWTQEKADKTLIEELEEYRSYVSKHLNNPNPNELGAFTSFAYNVGNTVCIFKRIFAMKGKRTIVFNIITALSAIASGLILYAGDLGISTELVARISLGATAVIAACNCCLRLITNTAVWKKE